jgi:TonB family protein
MKMAFLVARACASVVGVAQLLMLSSTQVAIANSPGVSKPTDIPANYHADSLLTRWMEPRYPLDALRNRVTGEVTLEFDVTNSGSLRNVEIIESTPKGVFDASVMDSLKYWTVVPYQVSRCVQNFPRSQMQVRFVMRNGVPRVEASRPLPLPHPNAEQKHSTGPATDIVEKVGPPLKKKVRWLKRMNPIYPRLSAIGAPIFGDVVARILVGTSGDVESVDILFSSPFPEFGEAARSAILNWKADTSDAENPTERMHICQSLRFRPEE